MLMTNRRRRQTKLQKFRTIGIPELLEKRNLFAGLELDSSLYQARTLLVQFQQPGEQFQQPGEFNQSSPLQSSPLQSNSTSLSNNRPNQPVPTLSTLAPTMRQLTRDGWFQVQIPEGISVSEALHAFQIRTDILFATPDFRIRLRNTPNDPGMTSTWGLNNRSTLGADIGANQAWNYGTSSSVVVAVIDSGIDYNHVDLTSNIWRNTDEIADNGKDDDQNGYVDDIRGWNFVNDNNNPMDDNGHGTHVAGTIGAVGNNSIGLAGINWSIQMMPLKFLDRDGSGMLSDAIAAIDYARSNGAKIINASWGSSGFSTALQSAIQRFQNAGGVFVAAAGNEGANNARVPSYPANVNLPSVISVAASTSRDTLANFSNYGSNVDIAAPGSNIYSTLPGNRYGAMSGTSMAAPHVAGALALLWGQNPSLTATQLIDAVMKNTDDVLRGPTIFGRLDLGKAAAALRGAPTDTVAPYVTSTTWSNTGSNLTTVEVAFSEAIQNTSLTDAQIRIDGPAGRIGLISVSPIGTDGKRWRIQFGPQSQVGTYTLQLTSTVSDLAGNRLDSDRDGSGGESTQDIFVATTTIRSNNPTSRDFAGTNNVAIRDASRQSPTTTLVPISVTGPLTITDINVQLHLAHTYISDLRLRLIAPNGTSVVLFDRRGGSRDDLIMTLDDQATTSLSQVTGNFRGLYRPEQSLSRFHGLQAAGTWQLEITDNAMADVGIARNVTLKFQGR